MLKKGFVIGISLLFTFTSASPMIFGFDSKISEEDKFLDNLAFYCYDVGDSNEKYEYYKELFQPDGSNYVESEVIMIPVESPRITSGGPMDSAWPMKCHDTHHTSRSQYSTIHITDLEKWRFRCGGVDGSPIIGDDGTIYFGDKDRDIYAIYPNGTLKWTYHTSDWITSAPALAEDGTLYVTSWDEHLYAFNSSNGIKKWTYNAGHLATLASSPIIAEDDTIYFGAMGPDYGRGRIYAVNPNGTEQWYYDTDDWITSDPAIGNDGTIYIGSGDTYFYAMNPNGTLKWRFKTGDIIKSPPSIAEDGTVYIGSFDDYLYALFPNNGTMRWKCDIWYGTNTNPSIASDGTIYVCSSSKMFAIYPNNGTKRWTYDFPSERHIGKSSQAISADGTIYVGTNIGTSSVDGGDIIAVNPDGTERWRKLIVNKGWVDSSPCIAEDGTVYIGSQSEGRGYIHAFGPVESNSPPNPPTISGETNGEAGKGYWYKFIAVDPDNNPVSFYIDWGDDSNTGWTFEGASGGKYYYEHTWSEQGNYTIRAKAKDVLGEESDWTYLEVTMPMNQQSGNMWFLRWLERFPRAFPILRHFLGLT